VLDLVGADPNPVARWSILWVIVVVAFFVLITASATRRWRDRTSASASQTPTS
jgi:uncharacterized membrane protein YhaH (DUF805 family)